MHLIHTSFPVNDEKFDNNKDFKSQFLPFWISSFDLHEIPLKCTLATEYLCNVCLVK